MCTSYTRKYLCILVPICMDTHEYTHIPHIPHASIHTHTLEKLMLYHSTDFENLFELLLAFKLSFPAVSHVQDEKKAVKPKPVWLPASASPPLSPHFCLPTPVVSPPLFLPSGPHSLLRLWRQKHPRIFPREKMKFKSTTSPKHNYFHSKIRNFHPSILRKCDVQVLLLPL